MFKLSQLIISAEEIPDRMPEEMPNRMSEEMPEEMPQPMLPAERFSIDDDLWIFKLPNDITLEIFNKLDEKSIRSLYSVSRFARLSVNDFLNRECTEIIIECSHDSKKHSQTNERIANALVNVPFNSKKMREKRRIFQITQDFAGRCNVADLLAMYHSIETLDLERLVCVTDANIVSALSAMKLSLKIVKFSPRNKLTDAIAIPLETCTSLQDVSFGYCETLTDHIVSSLAQSPQRTSLKRIDLQYCIKLTNTAVASLSYCTSLRELDLSYCTKLTNSAVTSLIGCTSLETLSLAHCTELTDDVAVSLIRCTSLKILCLSECCKLTDAIAPSLLKVRLLYNVSLARCCNLTDTTAKILTNYPSRIVVFNFRGCEKMSPANNEEMFMRSFN